MIFPLQLTFNKEMNLIDFLQQTHSDDNKCIVANGKTIINVGADNLCQVAIIHFAQHFY